MTQARKHSHMRLGHTDTRHRLTGGTTVGSTIPPLMTGTMPEGMISILGFGMPLLELFRGWKCVSLALSSSTFNGAVNAHSSLMNHTLECDPTALSCHTYLHNLVTIDTFFFLFGLQVSLRRSA